MTENEMMRFFPYFFTLICLTMGLPAAFASYAPSAVTGLAISYNSDTAHSCFASQNQAPLSQVSAIMSRNNLSVAGASSQALEQAIATVALKFEAMGRADLIKGTVIQNFPGGRSGGNCHNFTDGAKHIQMVTQCPKKDSKGNITYRNTTAQEISLSLIHEFFHTIGQSQNSGFYKSYQAAVNPPCQASGYGTHNDNDSPRNEEFAEVGAIFIHSPQLLLQKHDPACEAAFNFFKNNIFNGKTSNASICSGVDTAIASAGPQSPSGGSSYNGNDQTQQLALDLQPILNMASALKKDDQTQTEAAPALQVIPATAPTAQCNRSSGQCDGVK
jgi:hypothetical protein